MKKNYEMYIHDTRQNPHDGSMVEYNIQYTIIYKNIENYIYYYHLSDSKGVQYILN